MSGSRRRRPTAACVAAFRAKLPSACARRADPSRLPDRVRRDADLKVEIRRLFEENFRVYGASAYFDGVDAPARRHCNVSLADPLRATRRSDIHASSCDYRR